MPSPLHFLRPPKNPYTDPSHPVIVQQQQQQQQQPFQYHNYQTPAPLPPPPLKDIPKAEEKNKSRLSMVFSRGAKSKWGTQSPLPLPAGGAGGAGATTALWQSGASHRDHNHDYNHDRDYNRECVEQEFNTDLLGEARATVGRDRVTGRKVGGGSGSGTGDRQLQGHGQGQGRGRAEGYYAPEREVVEFYGMREW